MEGEKGYKGAPWLLYRKRKGHYTVRRHTHTRRIPTHLSSTSYSSTSFLLSALKERGGEEKNYWNRFGHSGGGPPCLSPSHPLSSSPGVHYCISYYFYYLPSSSSFGISPSPSLGEGRRGTVSPFPRKKYEKGIRRARLGLGGWAPAAASPGAPY